MASDSPDSGTRPAHHDADLGNSCSFFDARLRSERLLSRRLAKRRVAEPRKVILRVMCATDQLGGCIVLKI